MKNIDSFNLDAFDPLYNNNINNVREDIAKRDTLDNNNNALPEVANCHGSYADVQAITKRLVSRGIDITSGYKNWVDVAFALTDAFGENGRSLFHELSAVNPDYDYAACDKKYTDCLRGQGNGIHIETFFYKAAEAGIDLREFGREKAQQMYSLQAVQESFQPEFANFASSQVCNADNKNREDALRESVEGNSKNNESEMQTCELANFANSAEQKPKNHGLMTGKTFSDKLRREDLPSILYPVLDNTTSASDTDKMLIGVLSMTSIVVKDGVYGLYDRRKVYSPLYNIVYGGPACGKGELEAVRHILEPIKKEMLDAYKADMERYEMEKALWENTPKKLRGPEPKEPAFKSPFISANSTASATYRQMDANGGWGIIFDTEADSMSNMLSKKEYGDYSDLGRKCYHHEPISMNRASDNTHVDIQEPKLAIMLTCTPSQIPVLLPANNVANGFASRFLFYGLPDQKISFRNVFANNDVPLEDIYKPMGQQMMQLWKALQARKDNPMQFVLSDAQQKEFYHVFNDVLSEQFAMLGDGIHSFIFRIALACFRYCLILTLLRRLSEYPQAEGMFEDDRRCIVCDDRDFRTSMIMIDCFINHTARVYHVVAAEDVDPFKHTTKQPSEEVKKFYAALPDGRTFSTAEAKKVGLALGFSARSVDNYLKDMCTEFRVVERIKYGVFCKVALQDGLVA